MNSWLPQIVHDSIFRAACGAPDGHLTFRTPDGCSFCGVGPYTPRVTARPPLTPRQQEILNVMKTMITEAGKPPRLIDMAARLGITNESLHQTLCILKNKGYLTWKYMQSATYRII